MLIKHDTTHLIVLLWRLVVKAALPCKHIAVISFLLALFDQFALKDHLVDKINKAVLIVLEAKVSHIFVSTGLRESLNIPTNRKKRSYCEFFGDSAVKINPYFISKSSGSTPLICIASHILGESRSKLTLASYLRKRRGLISFFLTGNFFSVSPSAPVILESLLS